MKEEKIKKDATKPNIYTFYEKHRPGRIANHIEICAQEKQCEKRYLLRNAVCSFLLNKIKPWSSG